MSLQSLRQMRLAGERPGGVVWIVVGPLPVWMQDAPDVVHVAPNSRPLAMDWRPVIGLTVAIFTTDKLPELTLKTLQAANDAGAKFFGLADQTGTYPTVLEPTQEHHDCLRKTWRLLCGQ